MLSTFFGSSCSLSISLDTEGKKCTWLTREKTGEKAPIYSDGEDVMGTAVVNLKTGKRLEHNGIKVELIGQLDMLYDRSSSYDFFSISKDLEPPGVLCESRKYKFKFNAVDKPHETVRVAYRGTGQLSVPQCESCNNNPNKSIIKEQDFVVQNVSPPPEIKNSIKMEVGIEDCLHIEFEFDRSRYHLKDVVVGKVFFVLVRIKIKDMQLDVIKVETAGVGSGSLTESETISKFEIMDGAPIKCETWVWRIIEAECIPVRLYLSGLDLTPTYKNIQNKFSVKYFLNLVLVDEEDRRYFKKQEIVLWRKKIG